VRATLASRKADSHQKTRNSAADQNASPSDLPRVPKLTPRNPPLARNLTSHTPTLALNIATLRARAA